MATSRSFAINPGLQISGTEKFGNLVFGNPTDGYQSTGLKWWNGPDEDLGYIIVKENPNGQSGADNEVAYLGFWRSESISDISFIELGNNLLTSSYVTAGEIKAALNSAGFWTSYNSSTELINPIITSNNEYVSIDEGVYLAYNI